MTKQLENTPLLSPQSPLDSHAKDLIQHIYAMEQAKAKALPTDDPLDPKRRRRVELTDVELRQQPDIIARNLAQAKDAIQNFAQQLAKKQINRIYMTGCGDSISSMLAVRAAWENLLGIPCEPVQALDFTYYYHKPVDENTLVITLSSSGKTVRTVEAMLIARALGAATLCLSNTAGSPLMNESDQGILIDAERKGWPTQSSTAAMALLYLLGIHYARALGKNTTLAGQLATALHGIPTLVQQTIDLARPPIQAIAKAEALKSIYLFAGGGPTYASAMIGAAKVKECAPDHAIAIPMEEFHHYNSQKAGDPLFLIAPKGWSEPRAMDTAREGRRWGGQIYTIATQGADYFNPVSDQVIFLPPVDEHLSPLLFTVPVQLFAYHVAMAKFHHAETQSD